MIDTRCVSRQNGLQIRRWNNRSKRGGTGLNYSFDIDVRSFLWDDGSETVVEDDICETEECRGEEGLAKHDHCHGGWHLL